ncbi:MAG TPA: LbtU family siderophore porin [Pseudomonadales bacterium]|nr:LbtU family siderophore porin [Pseudomonadales bacterium]
MIRTRALVISALLVSITQNAAAAKPHRHHPTRLTGLLLIDTEYSNGYADEKASNIFVDTLQVRMDRSINQNVSVHGSLLHEEDAQHDSNGIVMEEVYVTLSPGKDSRVAFTLGRQYLPFGNYSTHLITDPEALHLAKINDTAAVIKYGTEFNVHAFAMNGNTIKANPQQKKKDNAAEYGYGFSYEGEHFKIGTDWTNSICESDDVVDSIADTIALKTYVPGWDFHTGLTVGQWELTAEYVTATRSFDATELSFNGSGAKPSAWHIETAYQLPNNDAWLAFRTGQTREFLFLNQPKSTISLGYGQTIYKNTTLKLEAYRQKDYATTDNANHFNGITATESGYSLAEPIIGTGNMANGFIAQIGVAF